MRSIYFQKFNLTCKRFSKKTKPNNNINMTLSPPQGDSRDLTQQDGWVTSDRTRTRSSTQSMMVQFLNLVQLTSFWDLKVANMAIFRPCQALLLCHGMDFVDDEELKTALQCEQVKKSGSSLYGNFDLNTLS